ncbi:MAG: DUF4830 domain-containing protein [Clostridiales bacterium]|nr:DUF4830 domain-containing protein [Clostridiales bacterium]
MKKFIRHYKFKLIFILFTVFVITVIFALFSVDSSTNTANIEYITTYGWQVDSSPIEIAHVRLPEDLNSLYRTYNSLAAAQGYTLENYCGKNVTRYSYKVNNHKESSGDVRANIYVYKSQIIAADISILKPDGTTVPINDTSNMN